MPPVYRPLVSFIATAMQTVLNLGLLCLGVILIVFLGKETLPMAVLIYSAAILILVITLWLCNSNRLKRE